MVLLLLHDVAHRLWQSVLWDTLKLVGKSGWATSATVLSMATTMSLAPLLSLWCMQLRLTLATMCFLSHFQLSVV